MKVKLLCVQEAVGSSFSELSIEKKIAKGVQFGMLFERIKHAYESILVDCGRFFFCKSPQI